MLSAAVRGKNRENILGQDRAGYHGARPVIGRHHRCRKDFPMTQRQRLKYSILMTLVLIAAMLGLSWLVKQGMLAEQMFQYIAMGLAVIFVVINGILRRKVKP